MVWYSRVHKDINKMRLRSRRTSWSAGRWTTVSYRLYLSDINGDIGRKCNFSYPRVFNVAIAGAGFGILQRRMVSKTRQNDGSTERKKWWFIQLYRHNTRIGRKDRNGKSGHDRAMLTRDKNEWPFEVENGLIMMRNASGRQGRLINIRHWWWFRKASCRPYATVACDKWRAVDSTRP